MIYSSSFFDEIVPESLSSAKVIVPIVVELTHPSSVVDVGCAMGAWLSVFREHGIENIIGLDWDYVDRSKLLIPSTRFRTVDLAAPFYLEERFDLAVSLEVAEHLPATSAKGFVESLCRVAPVILFSAAVPGQGGTNHVNEQWPEYWRQLFAKQNFRMFDPFRPLIWHDERIVSHYRQNMFLLVHADLIEADSKFIKLPEILDDNGLMLISGFILRANVDKGLGAVLRQLPRLFINSVRRRFK